MSPTCLDDIFDMSATDKSVFRLRGVANRHICQHCQPRRRRRQRSTLGRSASLENSARAATGVAATLPAHLRDARVRDSRVSHQQQGTRLTTTTTMTTIGRNSMTRMTMSRTMEGEDTAAMEEGKGRGGTSGGRNTKLHSYISYSKCNLCNLGVNLGASALNSLNLNTQKTVFHLCDKFLPSQPSYVYLFCPKSDFFGENTNTHYKMTRILFVYL